MRQLIGWLCVSVLTSACTANSLPLSPSAPSSVFGPSRGASVDSGNWTPWFFNGWQPGLGPALVLGTTVEAMVEVDDVCVANLRQTWDARASCKRFVVSVSSHGWLEASIRWDPTAPGFDPSLSGDVVLVAPDGRFTASGWQHTEEQISGRVQPGNYGVLIMSYVPASLPFQITTDLRSD